MTTRARKAARDWFTELRRAPPSDWFSHGQAAPLNVVAGEDDLELIGDTSFADPRVDGPGPEDHAFYFTAGDDEWPTWEVRVDTRGIAYTHVHLDSQPLRLDECPELP